MLDLMLSENDTNDLLTHIIEVKPDAFFWFQKAILLIFYTLLDSLDPFLNQNNEKKIEKIVKKVRKSSQSQCHDFDLT